METRERLVDGLLDLQRVARSVYGEKSGQRRILLTLSEAGTLSQRELAARLGVSRSSASEILTKMVKAGLIERFPCGGRVCIGLTDAGRVQARTAAEAYRTACARLFSCLSGEEERTLLSIIERLSVAADAAL
ncbi:MAG: MarR family transcriptional regulator [Oscillibacter sp.]|nr:MarR family transcriptional regulator [Oscillibacter sp.]MBQ7681466.1 MarR family transcriptional regulator [Oscillibacter sp.]MBQ9616816.1 MarR family transcriptional regulator [Oscillibacter sp.]